MLILKEMIVTFWSPRRFIKLAKLYNLPYTKPEDKGVIILPGSFLYVEKWLPVITLRGPYWGANGAMSYFYRLYVSNLPAMTQESQGFVVTTDM